MRLDAALPLEVCAEQRHLAKELALAQHGDEHAVGTAHLHLPVADDVHLLADAPLVDDDVSRHEHVRADGLRELDEDGDGAVGEDGHGDEHVVVQVERDLGAQAGRELHDVRVGRGGLVSPPRVEVVLPDGRLQLDGQAGRLHRLVDLVHLLLQPRLREVEVGDEHRDVAEERGEHERADEHGERRDDEQHVRRRHADRLAQQHRDRDVDVEEVDLPGESIARAAAASACVRALAQGCRTAATARARSYVRRHRRAPIQTRPFARASPLASQNT
eukprot:6236999-Prymnesium_polylepis.2